MHNVICVVVTYNPNIEYFRNVISKILANNVPVIVVDNGSLNHVELVDELNESVTFLALKKNVGIAKAQNIGIEKAYKEGATHVWLSDQDTLYPESYITQMFEIIQPMESQHKRYGAIGPTFFELQRKRVEPFFRFAPTLGAFTPEPGLNSVSHVIASGMIIPKEAFYAVGPKREDFFIDWVDLEWCWRSNIKGYPVYGTGDVQIDHNLGDYTVKCRNREVSIRSPFRHYFMVRNGLFLCLYDRMLPFRPRLFFLKMSLAMIIIYPLLAPKNKLAHLKANLLGCWHALTHRLGPKP